MKSVESLRILVALATGMSVTLTALASDQIIPPGGIPCEADWMNRSDFSTVATVDYLQFLEREAERGEVAVQLRLGLVRQTRDGKWSVPEDRSYNIKWLEKAQAHGSKSAAWELAKAKRNSVTHEAYLRSAMTAAEEEGNPWAATELMNITNGRWGRYLKTPVECDASRQIDGKCAPPELLPISSARKWAEIAAEGGNAQAQEWLCWSAADGNPDRGQTRDDKAALKWCSIAVNNACSFGSLGRLATLVRQSIDGAAPNPQEADRIKKWVSQPWRQSNRFFFVPNQ